MRKYIVIFCAALAALMAACGKKPGGDHAIARQDLLHRRFVLVSSDGKNFSARERVPSIEFNEGLRISGAVCNRFAGQGRLAGNVLFVEQLASTKMFCMDPDLNELEDLLARMLSGGAELRFDGRNLVIRQGEHELLYTLND